MTRFEYEYPRPCVTVDCVVVFQRHDQVELLLIQRAQDPFKGQWALPGGFLDIDETLEQAAQRELQEETGVKIENLSFVGVYDKVDRDPRDRVISNAFLAKTQSKPAVQAADDATNAEWFDVNSLPELAFDHSKIVSDALQLI